MLNAPKAQCLVCAPPAVICIPHIWIISRTNLLFFVIPGAAITVGAEDMRCVLVVQTAYATSCSVLMDWSCGWLIHASISFLTPLLLVNDGEGRSRRYWWSYVIEMKLCGQRFTGYLTGAAQSLDRQHLRRSAVVRHPTSQRERLFVICTNYSASAVRSVQYRVCTAGSHSGNSDGGCLWDVTPWCLVSEKPTVPFLWTTPHIEVGGCTEPSVATAVLEGGTSGQALHRMCAGSAPDVRRPCAFCNTSDWPPDVLTSLFVSVFCPNATLPWTRGGHLQDNKTSVINGIVSFDP